jgi:hypothetical protein
MNDNREKKVSLKQVIGSVIASFLGVQRSDKYQRDFTHGKPHHYIIVGLVGTILFILFVVGLVKAAMYLAGV